MKQWMYAGLLAAAVMPAQADVLGIYAGGGTFQGSTSGKLGSDPVDLEQDLGLSDDDSGYQAYIAFEHPVPILPNIKVATVSFETDGQGQLGRDFEFGGVIIPGGATTWTDLDYEHIDVTLYYELWDTGFDLDLGLTARQVKASTAIQYLQQVELTLIEGSTQESFDEWMPMVYAAARVDLPLTGLYAAAEFQGTGYSDSSFLDYQARLGWTLDLVAVDLGLEVGYRVLDLDLDEADVGDLTADINIEGLFIHGVLHF
ncbi:TIGR04219 family outer membrane beta-barrel protein [Marinobacter hydrocarbonoclasticus]|nr:TIGR04219 family outer membrane beta-barrel protein [Marinobacter nauticus]